MIPIAVGNVRTLRQEKTKCLDNYDWVHVRTPNPAKLSTGVQEDLEAADHKATLIKVLKTLQLRSLPSCCRADHVAQASPGSCYTDALREFPSQPVAEVDHDGEPRIQIFKAERTIREPLP